MIINIHRPGRLGNQIYQHAHLLAFAIKNDTTFVNLAFTEYNETFNGTRGLRVPIYPNHKLKYLRVFPKKLSIAFCNRILRSISHIRLPNNPVKYYRLNKIQNVDLYSVTEDGSNNSIIILNGWIFTSLRDLNHQREQIIEYFTPHSSILDEAIATLNSVKTPNSIVVGCHIRRGDYKTFMDGKYYYDLNTYSDFCKQCQNLYPDKSVKFILCSDESINEDAFAGLDFITGSKTAIVDMYTLAKCDLIIGPPSTFSSWASFWGDVPRFEIKNKTQPLSIDEFKVSGKI